MEAQATIECSRNCLQHPCGLAPFAPFDVLPWARILSSVCQNTEEICNLPLQLLFCHPLYPLMTGYTVALCPLQRWDAGLFLNSLQFSACHERVRGSSFAYLLVKAFFHSEWLCIDWGAFFSQFTLKVSGQFALVGEGDAGVEYMWLLQTEGLGPVGCLRTSALVWQKWTQDLEWGEYYIYRYQYLVSPFALMFAFRIHYALSLYTTEILVPKSVLYAYIQITISTFATWYFHMCRPGYRYWVNLHFAMLILASIFVA